MKIIIINEKLLCEKHLKAHKICIKLIRRGILSKSRSKHIMYKYFCELIESCDGCRETALNNIFKL